MRYHAPVTPLPLTADQQLHFAGDPHPWTVKAVSKHFAVAVRLNQVGEVLYTVLDWRTGVRGPCNLAGQGWGDGTYTEAECTAMLAEFESGELEASHRNQVPIEFGEVA